MQETTLFSKLQATKLLNKVIFVLFLGALSSLALPPANFVPLLFVTFPLLLWLTQVTARRREAFITGWAFAFGYFVCSFYWISFALLTDAKQFGWLVPLAALVLPALLAIYYGIAAALARWLNWHGLAGVLVFALLFFAAECARGFLLTGFPWNLFGYAWSGVWPVMQITSIIGVYGLTLMTLVLCCLPALLLDKNCNRLLLAAMIIAPIIAAFGWGSWRLQQAEIKDVPGVWLRIVQPNLGQIMRLDPARQEQNFQELLELTATASSRAPTHFIWPETATQFLLAEDWSRRLQIAALLPEHVSLLTGSVRRDVEPSGVRYFNSLLALDSGGQITASYDKSHLVPFGEYVPFRNFPAIAAAAGGIGDFTAGSALQTLSVAGLPPFSPLICYEVIFSGAAATNTPPPDFLLNITNDAWYGRSAGPHQHLLIARVRAVEEGLPLIRAANTGISVVTDGYGRIRSELALGKAGVIDSGLPAKIATPTWFSRYHHAGAAILCVWFLGLAIIARRRQQRQ
jgi:apolipoprotein N-acyltransferase